MLRRFAPWMLPLVSLAACSPTSSPDAPATAPDAPSAVAVAPGPAGPSAALAVSAAPVVPAATASVASAIASASSAPLAVTPPPAASAAAPLPSVKVANIGIHIGGGPNDPPTKEPFKKSVFPHHDELRRCWGSFGEGQTGDMSIELKVEREGGKARVRPNKSTFKNKEMTPCVITVFEGIDFVKPRTGTTVLNYAIRFTPEK